jgi:hypothetical protein
MGIENQCVAALETNRASLGSGLAMRKTTVRDTDVIQCDKTDCALRFPRGALDELAICKNGGAVFAPGVGVCWEMKSDKNGAALKSGRVPLKNGRLAMPMAYDICVNGGDGAAGFCLAVGKAGLRSGQIGDKEL